MKAPPPLPRSVAAVWDVVETCRRCLRHPDLAGELAAVRRRYAPFLTVGLLPPGARRADYVLVGAEPPGDWVKDRAYLRERVAKGLRNFGDGRDVGAVQYAIERYLLEPGEGYYFTDAAKCTVPVAIAERTRELRYALCADYLLAEIELLRPRAIIAIGREVFRYLRAQRRPGWPVVFNVVHYSAVASAAHARLLEGDWRRRGPSPAKLDAFVDARRIESVHPHPFPPVGERHLRIVAAYRVQLTLIRQILEKGSFATGAGTRATIAVARGAGLSQRARAMVAATGARDHGT